APPPSAPGPERLRGPPLLSQVPGEIGDVLLHPLREQLGVVRDPAGEALGGAADPFPVGVVAVAAVLIGGGHAESSSLWVDWRSRPTPAPHRKTGGGPGPPPPPPPPPPRPPRAPPRARRRPRA